MKDEILKQIECMENCLRETEDEAWKMKLDIEHCAYEKGYAELDHFDLCNLAMSIDSLKDSIVYIMDTLKCVKYDLENQE